MTKLATWVVALSTSALLAGCADRSQDSTGLAEPVMVDGKAVIALGDWAEFTGTARRGTTVVDWSQRIEVVSPNGNANGDLSFQVSTRQDVQGLEFPKRKHHTDILGPTGYFPTSDIMFRYGLQSPSKSMLEGENWPRWETAGGRQVTPPSIEMVIDQARNPDEDVSDWSVEVLETPRGKLKCKKRRYQRSMPEWRKQNREGQSFRMQLTWDHMVWHTDAVPVVGYAKIESRVYVECVLEGPMPEADTVHRQNIEIELVLTDFGRDADSVTTD